MNEFNFKQLLGKLDKIIIKSSIAVRVSDTQKMFTPKAYITGVSHNKDSDTLSVTEKEIEAELIKVESAYTQEAVTDMFRLYKENLGDLLLYHLTDVLIYKLDNKFINMVDDRANIVSSYKPRKNDELLKVGQSLAIKINKGLSDLPISDNRSSKGWAIVSSDIASILAVTVKFDDTSMKDESSSYLGRIANVDYYIDFTHDNTNGNKVLFGIKGDGFSKGSTINSSYTLEEVFTVNPSTGNNKLYIYYRGKQSINPLDDSYFNEHNKSAFLGKFDVDLSSLPIMT